MADLNFGLLDTTLPARIAAIPQEAQRQQSANMLQAMQMQGAMQQSEMSQMQLAEMKADRAEMVKFQQELADKGGSPDLGQYADMLMRSPKHMKLGIELKQKLAEQAQFARIMGDAPAAAPEPGAFGAGAAAVPAQAQNNALAPTAPPVNVLAAGGDKVAALQRKRNALLSLGTPQAIAAARALDADIALAAKVEPTDPLIKQYQFAVNQGFTGTLLDYKERVARAGRAPAQPRPEQPPVAVVDPATNKTVYVSREEALRQRMTPANTVEKPMTQAQRFNYTKAKASDKDVVTGALAVTGELEKLTDELVGNPDKNIQPAPGLNSITGYSALTNPLSLPRGDARKALQKLETFKGKIMALGRQLASQEGKLGNMAVQEWKFVSDAVQKLDPMAGNLDDQMRDVVRQAKEYAQRQQSKYDDIYADDY